MATNNLTATGKRMIVALEEALGKEEWERQRDGFQEVVDLMLKQPSTQQYVRQGQLGLISSDYQIIDNMVREGILKVDRIEGKALMDRVFGA